MEKIISAPGKVLLIGGYSVLELGNIAYTASIDKRVLAKIEEKEEISLNIPQYDVHTKCSFKDGKLNYLSSISDEKKERLRFMKNSVELSLRYLKEKGYELKGFKLTTSSDPEFNLKELKAGFGSSSAVTAATVGAIFKLHNFPLERKDIFKISLLAHAFSQGKIGSGFDIATAVYGTCIYKRYNPKFIEKASEKKISKIINKRWDFYVEKVNFPKIFKLVVGFTGRPASTSEMVKIVYDFKGKNPIRYNILIEELERVNRKCVDSLRKIGAIEDSEEREKELEHFKYYFMESRELTRELGEISGAPIETQDLSRMIDSALKADALVSKLPGAGGGDNIIAICMDDKSKRNVLSTWKSIGIIPLDINIENKGLKVEKD